jgi:hypothetical protein
MANVPPTLEIEVLDPGVDPMGNPAVLLRNGGAYDDLEVDIPPVVLVHRYYYTGDRSFRGPMLPGGPSIIVVNHPSTGERCYIPVQMMPGSPRVTYTAHDIEYNYGTHAISVHFGWSGEPTIKYRSGRTLGQKVGKVFHAEQWKERTEKIKSSSKEFTGRSHKVLKGAVAEVGDAAQMVILPVQNMAQILPFGSAIVGGGGDFENYLAERADEHERARARCARPYRAARRGNTRRGLGEHHEGRSAHLRSRGDRAPAPDGTADPAGRRTGRFALSSGQATGPADR